MKKSKLIFVCIVVIAVVITIGGIVAWQLRFRQPTTPVVTGLDGSTLTPLQSEALSVIQSINNQLGTPKTIENLYRSREQEIRSVADFVLQYPMKENELMSVSNYEQIKIRISSTNSPFVDITDTVDSAIMHAINQLFAKNGFSGISSSYVDCTPKTGHQMNPLEKQGTPNSDKKWIPESNYWTFEIAHGRMRCPGNGSGPRNRRISYGERTWRRTARRGQEEERRV